MLYKFHCEVSGVEQGTGNIFYITQGYSRSYLRVRGERGLAVADDGGKATDHS